MLNSCACLKQKHMETRKLKILLSPVMFSISSHQKKKKKIEVYLYRTIQSCVVELLTLVI